jgi:hypothetical protein
MILLEAQRLQKFTQCNSATQLQLHAANAPSHVAGSDLPFTALKEKAMTHTTHLGRPRDQGLGENG